MSVFTSAVISTLKNDATIQGLLDSYGGQAAVFSISPSPGDSGYPQIVMTPVLDVPFETKTDDGRELSIDLAVYVEATGTISTLETIVERIRTLFHRTNISVSGFDSVSSTVETIRVAPTDENFYGRIVSLNLILQEQ